MTQVKKWEIVTLAIVIILGLVVSSFVTGSEPYEEYFTGTSEFDSDDPTVSGSATADTYMAFLGPDGEPIDVDGGLSLIKSGTSTEVTSWVFLLRALVVTGENVDYNTIEVISNLYVKWSGYEAGRQVTHTEFLGAAGDEDQPKCCITFETNWIGNAWEAKAQTQTGTGDFSGHVYVFALQWGLENMGETWDIPYKFDGFRWTFRHVIRVRAMDKDAKWIEADTIADEMSLVTNWEIDPANKEPYLEATALFGGFSRSFISTDTAGLSVTFFIVTIFVGIWYKWGRKLIHGT